jgi:hypothetical protein
VYVLSVREAIGGKWATNPVGWTILLGPATLLVVLQESNTPFPFWGLILVSALAQHVAGPIIAGSIAALARRRRKIIPLPVAYFIWGVIGVSRGLVAGTIASAFAGVEPDYAYRIVTWVAICLIWGPLFTYSMAQLDRRRELLTRWGDASTKLDAEQSIAGKSAVELQRQLIATMQRAISPVIDQIRASLVAVSGGIAATELSAIRFKLAVVGRDVERVLDPNPESQVDQVRPPLAPLSDAIDFEQSRPIFVSTLTGLTLTPLVIPDALRVDGIAFALEILVALTVSVVVMFLALITLRWWREHSRPNLIAAASIGFFLTGVSASLVLLLLQWSPFSAHQLLLVIALPFGIVFATACVSAAIGLALANANLSASIEQSKAESATLHKQSERTVGRVTKQLTELLHGPIQGRLSACAMALNFHASSADPADPVRIEAVTSSVRSHLELVSRDLEELGKR